MKIISPSNVAPQRAGNATQLPSAPLAVAEIAKTGVDSDSAAVERVSAPHAFKVPDAAQNVDNTAVQVHFDAMTKTLVASVVNKETGTVVTEVPPEALRTLAQRTAEFRGKIFNVKA
jgi:uncharacterized FlaG/YvyC family protein